MNYIKLLNTLGKLVKEGQIKSIDEAIQMVQKMGAQVDGLLKQGIENLFKTTKARDPDAFKGWTPKVIEGGKKEGVDNLFKNKESIMERSIYDIPKAGRESGLIEGVNWKDTPLPVNPKVESFYDELVENAYKESKKTGRDVKTIIEETIDYKFTGNETGKEILDIIEKKFFKADGGRIGFQQGGAYDARASMQDYASALKNVSGGRTYQQLDDLKAYARNLAADQLKAARFDKSPRGLGELYDKYFKGKAMLGSQGFNWGRTTDTMDTAHSYNLKDRDQILDDMAGQIMMDQQSYEVQKLNQQRIADKKAAQQAAREQQYADYMNNLISSTYGKADDYKAEAMTLGMPTSAYFDYLVTSDPKDVMTSYDTLSKDPYFDPKTYVPTDYSNPETPRPPSPYDVYFQGELQRQTAAGIPVGQRIQHGQVMGLPTVLPGGAAGSQMGPGYQPYQVALAQTKKQLGLKQGGRVGYANGGLNLTGQAKNIYDSWIAAGHSEEDALNYLKSRGLYNAPVVQQGIMTAPNIINQNLEGDGGDDGGTIINRYDPNINLGPNKDIIDYEADAEGLGPTWRGQVARLKNAFGNIPTPFNIVRMGIQKAQDWADQRRIEKEKAAAAAAQALQAQITNQANITARDLVAEGASPDWGKTETRDSSGWRSNPFKKGGLATMFTRRR